MARYISRVVRNSDHSWKLQFFQHEATRSAPTPRSLRAVIRQMDAWRDSSHEAAPLEAPVVRSDLR